MNLKRRLKDRVLSIGSWLTIGHSGVAEIMAKAGFDWLALDMEHSVISISEAGSMIRVIDLCGLTPLVRLTSNDTNQIKRVMDSGAHGIIVPNVNSAEEAKAAVDAVYYPPRGHRGIGLARAQNYGHKPHLYREWLAENAVVIVQIEHIDAVDNMESILRVDGVDGYFVGPYDMTGSMGIIGEFEHPDFIKALERVQKIGEKVGKPGGIHVIEPNPDQLRERVEAGHRFLAYSVDFRMLDAACRDGLSAVKF